MVEATEEWIQKAKDAKEIAKTGTVIDNATDADGKYIDVQQLDKVIVHELIKKIVVHQARKLDGQRVQQIDIYYRFVGKIK